jgi:hypothetical protein
LLPASKRLPSRIFLRWANWLDYFILIHPDVMISIFTHSREISIYGIIFNVIFHDIYRIMYHALCI